MQHGQINNMASEAARAAKDSPSYFVLDFKSKLGFIVNGKME
jgi:hypothetical protein